MSYQTPELIKYFKVEFKRSYLPETDDETFIVYEGENASKAEEFLACADLIESLVDNIVDEPELCDYITAWNILRNNGHTPESE